MASGVAVLIRAFHTFSTRKNQLYECVQREERDSTWSIFTSSVIDRPPRIDRGHSSVWHVISTAACRPACLVSSDVAPLFLVAWLLTWENNREKERALYLYGPPSCHTIVIFPSFTRNVTRIRYAVVWGKSGILKQVFAGMGSSFIQVVRAVRLSLAKMRKEKRRTKAFPVKWGVLFLSCSCMRQDGQHAFIEMRKY